MAYSHSKSKIGVKMKIIILLMFLSANVQAINIDRVELSFGGWSAHLFTDGKYNSTHNIKGLGVYSSGYYAALSSFENSFYFNSYSLAVGKEYGNFLLGINLATGYDKAGMSNIGKLSLAPALTYQPKILGPIKISLISNALLINFAVRIY